MSENTEKLREALEGLVNAVGAMKVPQTLTEAALQVEVTLGPAFLAARAALAATPGETAANLLPWKCTECGAVLLSRGEHARQDCIDERSHIGTLIRFDRRDRPAPADGALREAFTGSIQSFLLSERAEPDGKRLFHAVASLLTAPAAPRDMKAIMDGNGHPDEGPCVVCGHVFDAHQEGCIFDTPTAPKGETV